jgi:hypothetical protein
MKAEINIDLKKVEYELGVSYHDALAMAIRTNNELHDIVMTLQDRVLALEVESRCTHLFKKNEVCMKCEYCGQVRGF